MRMQMKVMLLSAMLIFVTGVLSAQQKQNIAYQDSQVRFTVITDGVIRLEWQPEGQFTDLPSFVASEREFSGIVNQSTAVNKVSVLPVFALRKSPILITP